jgi:SAM-dependent methyltransferase
MTAAERWLAAAWPIVRGRLPTAPARVIEIGCGPLGGFVPMLRASGYEPIGVDPEAPAGGDYRRVAFEEAELPGDVDAVVASTSLHHVADPEQVLGRIASMLAGTGVVVVIEWDWQAFDQRTAEWCFRRVGAENEGWLHRRRGEWLASGQPWEAYLHGWAQEEGLHAAETLLRLLDVHFRREHLARGPYFFPDLAGTSADDELAAIRAGEINAARVDYVGRPGSRAASG